MTKIWLNHWFSTAYHIIRLIKEGEKDFFIIGSNERSDAVYKEMCDEFCTEPVLPPDEYAAFCLDFCTEHGIDVFLPRRGMQGIAKHIDEFTAAGVKVMADPYDKLKMLNSKTEAYAFFKENGIASVPDHFLVNNVDEFKNAYLELSEKYEMVCFKKVSDEGGMSFRMIDNSYKGSRALFCPSRTRITYADAVAALSERATIPALIVMPYLSGREVSVDALATPSGNILLPRVKTPTRTELISFDPYILSVCE
ncbi:MAG: ATP-grasp domain-containing protein, partial [Ruminococcus sp.]|nr:ATP-grasp domain-containing protein [Ruminococcus sp.]